MGNLPTCPGPGVLRGGVQGAVERSQAGKGAGSSPGPAWRTGQETRKPGRKWAEIQGFKIPPPC